ncbi:MAG: HEAT repeat domain-containing protein, partial [Pseudobdellovibrionaceae bacterium]
GGNNGGDPNKQGDVETQDHKESYRFILNGCDTGKHDFGNSSAEETKKQLCDALQDDVLNGSCAEPLRQDFFNKKCSGYSWSPKYQTANPANPPTNPPQNNVDYAKEEKVRNALKYLLVETHAVANTLSGQEKEAVNQFAEDLMSCGLSYVGPKCLDYVTYAGNYGGTLNEVDGKFIFYSELKIKGINSPIAFVFAIDQVEPSVKVKLLEVSKILKPRNGQKISDYLKDASNLSPVVKVTLADDFQQSALKRLQKPRDVRELYHVSKMLLEIGMATNNYQQVKNKIAVSIKDNKNVITQSSDVRYQEEILSLITNEIQLKADVLVEICEGLIKSTSKNVQQIAATIILDAQPNRTELKAMVLEALNNTRWDIRKKAISAISKTSKTTAEENLLIAKVDDQDEDVRKEAVKAVAKISLAAGHLQSVKDLSNSSNWWVRAEAVKLLGRINSQASVKELIGKMDDSDEDVRKQVVSQLGQSNLNDEYVQSFAKQMTSSNWSVRNDAAKFLGKIGSDASLSVLIGAMDDSDEDVRKTVVQQLSKKPLKESMVGALAGQYKSQNWSVRRDVSLLLGKIAGLSSTNSLIKQMDDSDEDVRNTIVTQLTARSLTAESVANLKKNFSSQNWSVRRDVAKLLGKIKSPSSLEALQDQLTKESDDDVKNQIIASIKAVKN